jgi:hypothetical protein
MVAFPKPQSRIPGLVYAAREAENEAWDGLGFSPSDLGSECDRALWLKLHWAPAQEQFDGRMLRLFETGHIQEERLIADLRRAGIEVYDVDPDTGKQFLARALAGHVRGKLDGIATSGVPEAPAKVHVVECKSHGLKSWNALLKAGTVKLGKFEHWAQCQVYMHIRGIDRALYVAVCKDTDALYCERVEYDHDWCTHLMARLERILGMERPPAPVSTSDKSPVCQWCRAKPICRGLSFARLNCRTCLHSAPDMSGDAAWSCARWTKPLTIDEQRAACPAHLYVPDLVPGEMGDVDDEAETISYTLRDGRTWIDGRDQAEAPVAVEGDSE